MDVNDKHTDRLCVFAASTNETDCNMVMTKQKVPFLISSPLISLWRSSVMLFGATYSAAAVSRALEINPEMNGKSMIFGRTLFMGTTEMVIRGSPISVTRVVFTLSTQHELRIYERLLAALTKADRVLVASEHELCRPHQ